MNIPLASNYSEGDNEGAYIVIMDHGHADSAKITSVSSGNSNSPTKTASALHYSVHHYRTQDSSLSVHESNKKMAIDKKSSINELIFKRKKAIQLAFECLDEKQTFLVTREKWAETMSKETKVKIRWLSLLPSICPKEGLTPTMVNYRIFLEKYAVPSLPAPKGAKGGGGKVSSQMMDSLYGNRRKLEAMFQFFDTNGDGVSCSENNHNNDNMYFLLTIKNHLYIHIISFINCN